MQDLRLVGVHDDGGHLLLSGPGGAMFQLPIDEALRAAASRTPA
ncbi:septation protein SepH, partial [Paenarthrobacter nicotinovorans]